MKTAKGFAALCCFIFCISFLYAQIPVKQPSDFNVQQADELFTSQSLNLNHDFSKSTTPQCSWVKEISGGDGDDENRSFAVDNDGNFYLLASISGSVTFKNQSFTSNGFFDILLMKISNDGNVLWHKQYSCGEYTSVYGNFITFNNNGNLLICGQFSGTTFNIGTSLLNKSGETDIFFAELNQNGDVISAYNYGESGYVFNPTKIASDLSSDVYILNVRTIIGSTETIYSIKKFTNGSLIWSEEIPYKINDMLVYKYGIYYAGILNGNITLGSFILETTRTYNAFFAKLNSQGEYIWATNVQHNMIDYSWSTADKICIGNDDKIYTTGLFRADLSLGDSAFVLDRAQYTAQCDTNGVFGWINKITLTSNTTAFSIFQDEDNNIFMGGNGSGSIGEIGLNNNWLVKFNNIGEIQWGQNLSGDPGIKAAFFNQKIYVAGKASRNMFWIQYNEDATILERADYSSGNSGTAEVNDILMDSNQKIYVCGKINKSNENYLFLNKYDINGTLIWSQKFYGANNGSYIGGHVITLDNDENIIFIGKFYENMLINNIQYQNDPSVANVFIAKFNPDGNFLWYRQAYSTSDCEPQSIISDSQNNIIISGRFINDLNFDNSSLISNTSWNNFIAKFSSLGELIWSMWSGGSDIDYGPNISCDEDDNIYFSGEYVSRDIYFDDTPYPLTEDDGDIIVAKYSSSGERLWIKNFGAAINGASRTWCWPYTMKTTPEGTSYIVGHTNFANIFGSDTILCSHANNYFIMKLDNLGNYQWTKTIEANNMIWWYPQIDIDEYENIYLPNIFRDSLYFGNTTISSTGKSDGFVAKYTKDGDVSWFKVIPAASLGIETIYAYEPNRVIIGGRYSDNLNIDTVSLHRASNCGIYTLLGETINERIISTPTQNAFPGDTIEVNINTSTLIDADKIISFQLSMNYSDATLEYIGYETEGSLSQNALVVINNMQSGLLNISGIDATPFVGSGSLLKLYFKVIQYGNASTQISNFLFNTRIVNNVSNGLIRLHKYGDIDKNIIVQAYDAALALQFSVGLDPLPEIDPLPWEFWRMKAADVDGEIGIIANDASDILKYSVGLITKFVVEEVNKTLLSIKLADVTVNIENNEIVFRSNGEMFGLNVFVNENFSVLGQPQFFGNNKLTASNISTTKYAVGIAYSIAPANNEIFMKIPFTTNQNTSVTIDMIINTVLKSVNVSLLTDIVTITETEFHISPNPVKNELVLRNLLPNSEISIYDLTGKLVFNLISQSSIEIIDVSKLVNGLYTLKVNDIKSIKTVKFIKQ